MRQLSETVFDKKKIVFTIVSRMSTGWLKQVWPAVLFDKYETYKQTEEK